MVEGPGRKPTTTLTQLHERYGPDPSGSGEGEYLLRDDAEDGVREAQLYTRAPSTLRGNGEEAVAIGLARQKAAQFVQEAMANEYPSDVVATALRNVRVRAFQTEKRFLDDGMTRGDLNRLHEELQYRELERLNQELQQLRDRVPRDEPETIKDELAKVWRSLPDVTRASRWPSAEGSALITLVTLGYLQQAELRYDGAAGTLRVTPRVGFVDAGLLEANMTALATFIQRHFGARPGELSFAYIASNIMSYLPQGKPTSMPDKMQAVAGGAARPDANAARSMFTFSANKDVVSVVGDTDIPFEVIGDGAAGPVDFSKFRFARHEEFEISRERLSSAPTVFDARANLLSVKRVDTIDWANSR
jgi:hypothetical protein